MLCAAAFTVNFLTKGSLNSSGLDTSIVVELVAAASHAVLCCVDPVLVLLCVAAAQ
jgi:hypothetical protein